MLPTIDLASLDEQCSARLFQAVPPPAYRDQLLGSQTPIVIDFGSYQCRAGWANEQDPRLVFRNVVVKHRWQKSKIAPFVGYQIPDSELYRYKYRSPFDGNVIAHLESTETVLDHVFAGLGMAGQPSVQHPVLITEPLSTPNYSRAQMSELLFEGYGVPSICYSIADALSFLYNRATGVVSKDVQDALIVGSSFETTHLVPIVRGQLDPFDAVRIGVGGLTSQLLLLEMLAIKNSTIRQHVTAARAESMFRKLCYVAEDYTEELSRLSLNDSPRGYLLDLPAVAGPGAAAAAVPTVEEKKKLDKKQLISQKLRESAAKRKQETVQKLQEDLEAFEALKTARSNGTITDTAFVAQLRAGGFADEHDFNIELTTLRKKVQRLTGASTPNKPEAELYPLLNLPDEQLTPEQLKDKKRQRQLKQAADMRAKKKKEKEEKQAAEATEKAAEDKKKQSDPAGYLAELRKKREELMARRAMRHGDGEPGKRASSSRKRLQLLAQLGAGDEDGFGDDTGDWAMYRQAHGSKSDSEQEREQLSGYDARIAELEKDVNGTDKSAPAAQEDARLVITSERIRATEAVFQPCVVGLDQTGISDVVRRAVSRGVRPQVLFLTGGNTLVPGWSARLQADLASILSQDCAIVRAADPLLDAWRGGALYAQQPEFLSYCLTKADYEEKGSEYLKEHPVSNVFCPTPGTAGSVDEGLPIVKRRRRGI